jgi:hypothetical protein
MNSGQSVTPCEVVVTDTRTELARACASTIVSRIGYCERCGAYRQEYDQEDRAYHATDEVAR